MKIAFAGEQKCSVKNMLAMALVMHSENNKRILLVDSCYSNTDLEDAFRNEERLYVKEESYYGIREGMDYFLYRMNNGSYNASYTKEGVSYLTSDFAYIKTAVKGTKSCYEQQFKTFANTLLKEWGKDFDVVMIKCDDLSAVHTEEIIKNCDVCVASFGHENLIRCRDKIYEISKKKYLYILIGQVIGNCEVEKQFLTNICRINEDKIGLVPYNPYFEIKIDDGKLLNLLNDGRRRKAPVEEFIRQMRVVLHRFKKYLEGIGSYD